MRQTYYYEYAEDYVMLKTVQKLLNSIKIQPRVKPGFHYPSWRPELTGDRFPLPFNTARVEG